MNWKSRVEVLSLGGEGWPCPRRVCWDPKPSTPWADPSSALQGLRSEIVLLQPKNPNPSVT